MLIALGAWLVWQFYLTIYMGMFLSLLLIVLFVLIPVLYSEMYDPAAAGNLAALPPQSPGKGAPRRAGIGCGCCGRAGRCLCER